MVVKLKLFWAILRLEKNVSRNKFDQERYESNLKLACKLLYLVAKNPNQRFSQILRNYGFVRETRPVKAESLAADWKNEFYLEPKELLNRVERVANENN